MWCVSGDVNDGRKKLSVSLGRLAGKPRAKETSSCTPKLRRA